MTLDNTQTQIQQLQNIAGDSLVKICPTKPIYGDGWTKEKGEAGRLVQPSAIAGIA